MKIAIDAIGINKFGGGRTATLKLLEALFRMDKENEYVVAVSAKEPIFENGAGNVKQWIIPIKNRFLVRLYAQILFPFKFRNFDVIHFTKNLNLIGPLPPQVVTIFDLTALLHPELMPKVDFWYYGTIQKLTIRLAKRVIAISKDAAKGVQKYYHIPAERICVVYLAAGEHFKPESVDVIQNVRSKYGISDNYFIHVGHLDRKKNLPLLVRAYDHACKQTGFTGNLVLVGEAYPKGHDESLVPTIEQLGLKEKVIFTGGASDEELPALLSGAIAKVFPSVHEGFGLAAMEALACGTPLITGHSGAVSEVVGDAGIVLDTITVDSVASAMVRLIEDKQLRKELHGKGVERAGRFSWKEAARQTLEIYREVARAEERKA